MHAYKVNFVQNKIVVFIRRREVTCGFHWDLLAMKFKMPSQSIDTRVFVDLATTVPPTLKLRFISCWTNLM